MKVGLIGCGAWGKNYLRILNELKVEHAVLDPAYPDTPFTTLKDMIAWCDAAIVATPASTHAEIACELLEAGKHVLVEKPMATSVADAESMMKIAKERRLDLMVSSPFLFHSLPEMKVTEGTMQARWVNRGRERTDVSKWWDMAPHPIAMMSWFAMRYPKGQWLNGGRLLLDYGAGLKGEIFVSWQGDRRERTMTIPFSTYTASLNFNVNRIHQPEKEPLKLQMIEFLAGIIPPGCRPRDGTAIVKVLEQAGC